MGLELSNDAIQLGAESNVKILNESIQEHTLNNSDKYDVVCSFQVLEHISDIHGFIKASLACLKISGILIITVPADDSFVGLLPNCTLNLPPHHLSRWSDKTLISIGEIFGIKTIQLHHDILGKTPLKDNLFTIFKNMIYPFFYLKSNTIYKGIRFKIANKLAAIILNLFNKKYSEDFIYRGHSVTIIFQNKNA